MKKYPQNKSLISLFLSLLMAGSLSITFSTGVQAENKSNHTTQKQQVTFEPPQGSKPQTTVGGASRGGQCPMDTEHQDLPLTPLLPAANPALTAESHPTLLVYVPKSSATTALLIVKDTNEEYDYQTQVSIGDRPGIVSLTLPNDAPALNVNQEYQWSLVLMCDGKLRPDSPVAQGDIKRVVIDSNLTQKLTTADLLESAAIFGQAGLWYDTITALSQVKIAQSENVQIASTWENLLKTSGLSNIAKAEFVE
jgi:hypothetical protein